MQRKRWIMAHKIAPRRVAVSLALLPSEKRPRIGFVDFDLRLERLLDGTAARRTAQFGRRVAEHAAHRRTPRRHGPGLLRAASGAQLVRADPHPIAISVPHRPIGNPGSRTAACPEFFAREPWIVVRHASGLALRDRSASLGLPALLAGEIGIVRPLRMSGPDG